MSTRTINIRHARAEDMSALQQFLVAAYGEQARAKWPERWQWQFRQNPAADPESSVVLALHQDRIIGQLGLQHCTLESAGGVLPAAWGVDFHVLPEYRGRGVGVALQRHAFESCPVGLALSCSPAARTIKRALGWRDLAPVPVYRRWLRVDPAHVRGSRLLARLGTVLARTYGACRACEQEGAIEITAMRELPHTIDPLARSAIARTGLAATRRDAATLNWRSSAYHPDMLYHRWLATVLDDPTGVMVARTAGPREPSALRILEWFGDGHETERALLWHAMQFARWRGLGCIDVAACLPSQQRLLRAHGFVRHRTLRPMARGGSFGAIYATLADHDVDQPAGPA